MEWLLDLDQRLFLLLNGMHASWLDTVMSLASGKWFWLPLYAALLFWLVSIYKQRVWRVVLAIIILIVLTDRISSGFFKPLTHRLRPCHTPEIAAQVHVVDGCGGQFGFMSSHAANVFGLAMLLWLLLGRRHPWLSLFFAWALLVGYSRIYVGAHYPLDVLAGFGLGAACALLVIWFFKNVAVLRIDEPILHRQQR